MKSLSQGLHSYRSRFERDLTAQLHEQERSAVGGHVVTALLVAYLLHGQVGGNGLGLWIGAILVASAFRGWNAWRFSGLREREISSQDHWLHSAAVLACGLSWGLGFVLLMPGMDTLYRAIVLMVLSGLTSAAVVTLSARASSFAFFACAMMVPGILALAVRGRPTEQMIAGLGCAALAFGFASAMRARSMVWGRLLQGYRNDDMVRDLAAAKRTTSEALQRSEAANQAKSEFLANMSHEVRTPMNGILGMAELLGDGELAEPQKELLAILQSSAHDLLAILDDVLDLTKIESDRYEFKSEPFSVPDLFDDLASRYTMAADEKGLHFVYDAPLDLPPQAVGDAARIRQLCQNLLDNAVKFTERGVVTLSLRMIDGGPKGSTLKIVVRDQGPGIAPEEIERVFESFTQGDGSTTRTHGGTGLGLTITRRLLELMGGTLDVQSELQSGSTFEACLPLEVVGAPRAATTRARIVLAAPGSAETASLLDRLESVGAQTAHWPDAERLARALEEDPTRRADFLLFDPRLGLDEERLQSAARTLGATLVALTDTGPAATPTGCARLARPYRIAATTELLMPAAPRATETDADADVPAGPLRVLVAEDNPTNARIAQRILEQFEMQVVIARNGREAVELFREQPPDLIFMDVQMPELDGMEATQAIRALPGGDDVPIIALTAHAMKGYREKCLEAGMDDYFTKPLRRADLTEALRRWQSQALRRRRA